MVGAEPGFRRECSERRGRLRVFDVAAQIGQLGAFETFLLAVMLAGVLQIIMGIARLGYIAAFFPGSVIKGLLAAIGVILIGVILLARS